MDETARFAYGAAFSRNLGWVTEAEQLALRGKRVAIAGLGGVGGSHLLTLARLGIGAFHIADFDTFDLANFNRQVGANVQTLGRPKVEVLAQMAAAINPDLQITRFDQGITADNIGRFLQDVDLFVDGFDFFVLDMRRRVFACCAERGIPAVTAAPIGMGTAFLAFAPRGMSFEDYFRLQGHPENEQFLRFLVGLAPRGLHRTYLMDPNRADLIARRVPSLVAGCELCAGVTAVMAVKLLLGRGGVKFAPCYQQYDAYRNKLAVGRLNFGNAGPLQQLKLMLARKAFGGLTRPAPAVALSPVRLPPDALSPVSPVASSPDALSPAASPIAEILHAARWAPSGDNEQPWHFEALGDDTVAVHLHRPSGSNVYEYRDGEPLLLAGGMLLECLRIAATAHGRDMRWQHDGSGGGTGGGSGWPDRIVVRFTAQPALAVDPLYSSLGLRSVDRRRYRTRPLRDQEQAALQDALGPRLLLNWYTPLARRLQFARLSARATDIRLRTPEAFRTHQKVIDWQRRLSPTGIPAGTLGLDAATIRLMRWAMQGWSRTRLLNRLGSTTMAAIQLDYAPILASAACFTVRLSAPGPAGETREVSLLQAGQHLQRFWLTATRLGLALQPLLATLIFAHYGTTSQPFTVDAAVRGKATDLAAAFQSVLGAAPDDYLFMGRIGEPRSRRPDCRSVRRSLAELLRTTAKAAPATTAGS